MKINSVSFVAIENTKRIQPKDVANQPTPSAKQGIKSYNKVLGAFLFLFCVASRIEDASGKVWYVNKASLQGWGKSNSGEDKFKLRNLDKLLQNMKAPRIKTSPQSVQKASSSYTEERIGKELWLREGQCVSESTQEKVNAVSEYLEKEGFELVGAHADGNCYFDAFLKSLEFSSRKIPILQAQKQENRISYLRGFLSDLWKSENPERAGEIKQDKEFITALEGDKFASAFHLPIRVVTPNEEMQMHDSLTFIDPKKDAQTWETLENKPKTGEYLIIVDLGRHFITAKPKSIS